MFNEGRNVSDLSYCIYIKIGGNFTRSLTYRFPLTTLRGIPHYRKDSNNRSALMLLPRKISHGGDHEEGHYSRI